MAETIPSVIRPKGYGINTYYICMFIIPFLFPVSIAIRARIICQHLPLISAPNLRREYTARRLPGSCHSLRLPALYCELATALQYDRQNKQDKGKGRFFPPAALYVLCPMKLLINGYIEAWLLNVYMLYTYIQEQSLCLSDCIYICVCIYYIYS